MTALTAALDGIEGAAAPEEWIVSRVCEEFNCTPLEALRQPADLVFDIMELRAFARAKEFIDMPETDEEAIAKAGISERLVSDVFAARERLARR